MKNILFIVGSLRKQSFNRQLAAMAEKMLSNRYKINYLSFEDVPLMNQDLEAATPAAVSRVRKEVLAADGQTGIALGVEAWTKGEFNLTEEQIAQLKGQAERFAEFVG